MAATILINLPALALPRRSGNRLAIDDVSLAPFWRSLLFVVALGLPVLGSTVADRFPRDAKPGAVGALTVPHAPLGGAARKPDRSSAVLDGRPAVAAAR